MNINISRGGERRRVDTVHCSVHILGMTYLCVSGTILYFWNFSYVYNTVQYIAEWSTKTVTNLDKLVLDLEPMPKGIAMGIGHTT